MSAFFKLILEMHDCETRQELMETLEDTRYQELQLRVTSDLGLLLATARRLRGFQG